MARGTEDSVRILYKDPPGWSPKKSTLPPNYFGGLEAVEIKHFTGGVSFYLKWGEYLFPMKTEFLREGKGIRCLDEKTGVAVPLYQRTQRAEIAKDRFLKENGLSTTKFPLVKYKDDTAYFAHFLPARSGVFEDPNSGKIFGLFDSNREGMEESKRKEYFSNIESDVYPFFKGNSSPLYSFIQRRLFGVLAHEFPVYIKVIRLHTHNKKQ